MEPAGNPPLGVSFHNRIDSPSHPANGSINSAAELTSGNLVVSAPEVGTLLSRRGRRRNPKRPTTSILEASAARVAKERASRHNKDPNSCYYELEEGNMYDARVSPVGGEARIYQPETNAVQVRHEITVMSEGP
jgi:hypothetical protein